MLGFMISTVLISMWISNTAASAMMVPIVTAVLEEIYGRKDAVREYATYR
jgi:sodium-dependent dicarboxylate transporter 2/3/5